MGGGICIKTVAKATLSQLCFTKNKQTKWQEEDKFSYRLKSTRVLERVFLESSELPCDGGGIFFILADSSRCCNDNDIGGVFNANWKKKKLLSTDLYTNKCEVIVNKKVPPFLVFVNIAPIIFF